MSADAVAPLRARYPNAHWSGACQAAICDTAVAVCQRRYKTSLRAVILTGSMARGEATVLRTGGACAVAGDAEFILVIHTGRPLPPGGDISQVQDLIERELADQGIRCSVSLGAAHERYLRSLRPHIFGYELRVCGKVLWGELDILQQIPGFPAASVPREDAWRLLSNRIMEQCDVVSRVRYSGEFLPPELYYATIKLYLDMATSLLVFAGRYAPTYGERNEQLRQLQRHSDGQVWPFRIDAFARTVDQCTKWKLDPEGSPCEARHEFWQEAAEYARRLWLWETAALTGPDRQLSAAELWRRSVQTQALRNRVRGWLYVLRQQGWHRSWRNWPRWLVQMSHGSPRANIYSAGCELFFRLPKDIAAPSGDYDSYRDRELQRRLPVIHNSSQSEGWPGLAREIAWNYKKFVTETTA